MRSTRAAVLCGLLLWAAGCPGAATTDPGPGDAEVSASPPSTPAPAPAPIPEPIPADLRLTLPSEAAARPGSVEIDLASVVTTPTLDEAPVRQGLLIAQLSLFSSGPDNLAIRPGHPYLLSRSGEWRQFDLPSYGFRAETYGEMSVALSPDGRMVALADPTALVTVDLRDNTFRRFDLPVREAIALKWSADASTLLLKDRHSGRRPCGPTGCSLDVTTGALTTVPYDLFHTTHGADDTVVEVTASTRSRPGTVVTHPENEEPSVVEVDHRIKPLTGGGPAAAKLVAFAHGAAAGAKGERGVVVVEPTSGEVVALLQDRHLGANTWLSDRHLLLDDWTTGELWLWDVPSGRFDLVGTSRTQDVNVKVAREVMAQRLLSSGTGGWMRYGTGTRR